MTTMPDTEPDDTVLTDLLTDLRHAFPEAFDQAVISSEFHYEEEKVESTGFRIVQFTVHVVDEYQVRLLVDDQADLDAVGMTDLKDHLDWGDPDRKFERVEAFSIKDDNAPAPLETNWEFAKSTAVNVPMMIPDEEVNDAG
jgi:hypothetical protein